MDGHLNHEQLGKTFMDLSHLYKEAARIGVRHSAWDMGGGGCGGNGFSAIRCCWTP
jgi:hypothetical protein